MCSVAFSPDGSRIVSGSWDKTLKLWDAASGQELQTVHGHEGPAFSVAFSPDGSRIASGSADHSGGADYTVKLWNAASGQELRTLKGHASTISNVAFSPDGSRIVSSDSSGARILWDAATGDRIEGEEVSSTIDQTNRSPDGRWLVVRMGTDLGLVDLEHKNQPRETALRQRSARIKIHWHQEQVKAAEEANDWYATMFHSAWLVKADREVVRYQDILHVSHTKWQEANKENSPVPLPPVIQEMLDPPQ